MEVGENISIIIPTLNRSTFLIRMLSYFHAQGFSGAVLLGDSSEDYHLQRTESFLQMLKPGFSVTHRVLPNKKAAECVRELLNEVETPYAVWMCDDDILLPAALDKAARFLAAHSEYSGAGGMAVRCAIAPAGVISSTARYLVRQAEEETGRQRLSTLLSSYSVISYSLHRTAELRKRFPVSLQQMRDVSFALELFPTSLLAVQGKVKMLPCLFVVRQMHEQRYLLADVFDWIVKPDWAASYALFRSGLSEALASKDGISRSEAEEVVKCAFWEYMSKRLSEKFFQKYHGKPRGVSNLLKRVLARAKGWTDPFSLSALLSGRSAHSADFLPVYQAILENPEERAQGKHL